MDVRKESPNEVRAIPRRKFMGAWSRRVASEDNERSEFRGVKRRGKNKREGTRREIGRLFLFIANK